MNEIVVTMLICYMLFIVITIVISVFLQYNIGKMPFEQKKMESLLKKISMQVMVERGKVYAYKIHANIIEVTYKKRSSYVDYIQLLHEYRHFLFFHKNLKVKKRYLLFVGMYILSIVLVVIIGILYFRYPLDISKYLQYVIFVNCVLAVYDLKYIVFFEWDANKYVYEVCKHLHCKKMNLYCLVIFLEQISIRLLVQLVLPGLTLAILIIR